MVRAAAVGVAVLASVVLASTGSAEPSNLLVAGNPEIAFIDADNDGQADDPDDCVLTATVDGSDVVEVSGTQPPGPNKLRVCDGSCSGDSFVSVDFLEVTFTECDYSGAPFIPVVADFCDTVASCTPNGNGFAHGGGAGNGAPLNLVSGLVTFPLRGSDADGFGNICNAGGPAVQVTAGGLTVLRELVPFPSSGTPTHLCVPDVPVQLLSGGFVLRPACFPVRPDGTTADIALSSTPGAPLALFDFAAVSACRGGAMAPTTSEFGLIALCATLLAGGTWMLARSRRFSGILPLL